MRKVWGDFHYYISVRTTCQKSTELYGVCKAPGKS